MLTLMVVSFMVLLLAGMPVAFAMAISGALAVLGLPDVALTLIPQKFVLSLNTFPLLAVPCFILAGELMNTGGITRRIVRLSTVLIGRLRGSLAHVTVVANMIMAGFSGSATADCVATGTILIPAMKEEGYDPGFAAGITAASSCIGPIIPPSLVMVIYGGITGESVGRMFMGGVFPGLVIGFALMGLVAYYARRYNWPRGVTYSSAEMLRALMDAVGALLAPLIIIGGIITGITTATEAGVVAVFYAFTLGCFVYKEIRLRDMPKILVNAAVNTAVPMLIISCASVFGWVLARQNFASGIVKLLTSITTDTNLLYLLIIIMLLIIGLFVEGLAALLIFVPVLFPLGRQLGYDSTHFALVIIITILIGTITPPVGLQLYVASSIAKVPISKVMVWPAVAVMVAVTLLVTYVPVLVTFLPRLFFGN
jgi:tripartite ATP-independent transporter DctM subunit